jgi:hypothetical protein
VVVVSDGNKKKVGGSLVGQIFIEPSMGKVSR